MYNNSLKSGSPLLHSEQLYNLINKDNKFLYNNKIISVNLSSGPYESILDTIF